MSTTDNKFCGEVAERLIAFWKIHRRFDANIRDLARHADVSPDTVYRWLNRKAVPKPVKARLIEEWLEARKPAGS